MNDDLERTLRDSLDRHAAGAGRPTGGIDDVYGRVDHRRSRRRGVAVVGSLVAVAAGVVGFAAVSGGTDPAAGTPDGVENEPATTAPLANTAWSCSGYIGSDDAGRDLYADCYPVTDASAVTYVIDTVPCMVTTTIAPPYTGPAIDTVPDMTAPVYTNPCDFEVPATSVPLYAIGTDVPMTAPPTTAPVLAVDCRGEQPGVTTTTTIVSTTAPSETFPGEQVHVVVPGDSLNSIAERFAVQMAIIANYNSWPDCLHHVLIPGDFVLIPPGAAVPPD